MIIKSPRTAADVEAARLLEAGTLTDWERGFVDSLLRQHAWSIKQRQTFNKIRAQYLEPPKTTEASLDDDRRPTDPSTLDDLF